MFPKSIESSSPATPIIIPATVNRRPIGDNGAYSLQRFLAARPDEDANVIFARRAVRESFPRTVTQAAPQPTRMIPLRPSASATCMLANSVGVQPQQALGTPRFQDTGAGISSPTHRDLTAATRTEQTLGFSLRTFLATDPVDDANASYGRIALNKTLENYCPPTQTLKDLEDMMGSDGKGYEIRRATLLPYDKSPQHKDSVTFWLDQLRKNETPGPGPSKPDGFF